MKPHHHCWQQSSPKMLHLFGVHNSVAKLYCKI
jgi:hypothetical protein